MVYFIIIIFSTLSLSFFPPLSPFLFYTSRCFARPLIETDIISSCNYYCYILSHECPKIIEKKNKNHSSLPALTASVSTI